MQIAIQLPVSPGTLWLPILVYSSNLMPEGVKCSR